MTGFASILLLLKKRRFGNILALSLVIFGLAGFSIIYGVTSRGNFQTLNLDDFYSYRHNSLNLDERRIENFASLTLENIIATV